MNTRPEQINNEHPPPETWVYHFGDDLYRFAFVRLKDSALAEDAVQETMLNALRSLHKFDRKSSTKTWLTSILKHKIVDTLRKNLRERTISNIDAEQEEYVAKRFRHADEWQGHWSKDYMPQFDIADTTHAETLLHNAELRHVLERCIEALSTRLSTIFFMREIDELSTEEICKELQISETNVWVTLHRARLQLRECVEKFWLK